jgi:hypothetical protein
MIISFCLQESSVLNDQNLLPTTIQPLIGDSFPEVRQELENFKKVNFLVFLFIILFVNLS